ncbi:IclR family transcriptional regulator [Acidovorax sp. NCPPB 3859]|nr:MULTISPECIES: IclR family transcriptional regulator [unclassified Acidovorax]MDA8448735.1 IclR family transcriptional regulator [Acidovorax sp. GBBC 3297]MDA8458146.1 IclR family transcriptional regulator [Acidovorax sp. GBBC 3333]MDA8463184.1 IclR family transcriptional regulator [Acidovorax sp. GBBC 3332]MDA8468211.1 IclR family transcriptional regulator [Acidovorax sp. GBBC 3299]WCM79817.1 IclR family transcriptional regulator [Acidovorax sp. GBBC 712]
MAFTPSEDDVSRLFNQSVEKGLDVLCAFGAQRRGMTFAEVAEAAGINRSSAQRMVYTLEQLGYVRKHPQTRRYELTPRVLRIGFNYLAGNPLIDLANPFLSELTNVTTETTCLTEADGAEMVYVARFVSAQFVPVHMPIGSRIPMYCTASGRAFLSALPEADALALIRQGERVAHTRHTLTDESAILEQLQLARQRGYAVNREELFLGDMTLAAPVVGGRGRPVAAVHVVAPTSRWTPEEAEKRLAPALIACARSLSNSVRALA